MKKHILVPVISILCTVAMGAIIKQTFQLNSFNAGELSPLMNSRSDFNRYKTGAKTLENMLVRAQGPIQRRPGTKYIATVKDANHPVRLIPFEYSTSAAYIIEAGHQYMRFYMNGGQILDEVNEPYTVTTPYDGNDLFELQFVQDAETMRIAHPNYPPVKLTYLATAHWDINDINFVGGPFLDRNTDKTSIISIEASVADVNIEGGAVDSYTTNDDYYAAVRGLNCSAQTFTASENYNIGAVSLKLFRVGLPGTLTASIMITNDSNAPGGYDLCSGTIDGDSLTTSSAGDWYNIFFTRYPHLTTDEIYTIVLKATQGNTSNYTGWRRDYTSPTYDGGENFYTLNGGGTWSKFYPDADFMFKTYALTEEDEDEIVVTDVNLISTKPIFDGNHVGALWQLSHLLDAENISGTFWTNGDSFSAAVLVHRRRMFTATTSGGWWGTFKIQRSYDDGSTWNTVYSATYSGDGNIQYTGTENEDDALYRVAILDQVVSGHQFDHNEGWCRYNLVAQVFTRNGVVKIKGYTDHYHVTATVQEDYELGSYDDTWRWSEGAWSDYRGWPRTIEHHEQRCIYGGSWSYPQAVWASIIMAQDDDYDNFDAGDSSRDNDAWTYILPGMNPIQWLKSSEYLMVGTTAGIGRLGQPDKPITPTFRPTFRLQARNGSAYMQPVAAVDAILFVERGNKKVREVSYTYAIERYVAPDMTILAEHITDSGIKQIDFQNRPDPILWCVRNDGVLLSFTYQRKNDVMAWAKQMTNGDFDSFASIPGLDEDQNYLVVTRANGKYVEVIAPFDWGSDQNDMWFVDCGLTDINSLSHLEGQQVSLLGNGRPIGDFTVEGGLIDPNDPNLTDFVAGLPFASIYESLPIVVSTNAGSSAAKLTQILSITLDLYKTLACDVGSSATRTNAIRFTTDNWKTTIPPFTGLKNLAFPRGTTQTPIIYIKIEDPVPFCLRGISGFLEATFD